MAGRYGGGMYPMIVYVTEARRHGLTVVGPTVNSAWHSQLQGTTIHAGLRMLRAAISEDTLRRLYAAAQNRPFRSIADLLGRVALTERELEQLIAPAPWRCLPQVTGRSGGTPRRPARHPRRSQPCCPSWSTGSFPMSPRKRCTNALLTSMPPGAGPAACPTPGGVRPSARDAGRAACGRAWAAGRADRHGVGDHRGEPAHPYATGQAHAVPVGV